MMHKNLKQYFQVWILNIEFSFIYRKFITKRLVAEAGRELGNLSHAEVDILN